MDRIAVFFVDAGEERGAGWEVAGEAGADSDVGGGRHIVEIPGLFAYECVFPWVCCCLIETILRVVVAKKREDGFLEAKFKICSCRSRHSHFVKYLL